MRTLIATAVFLALATGANAYCPPVPDTAETNYVQNNLNRTLCLANELAQQTNTQAYKNQIDITINKMQRDALQQRFQLLELQRLGVQNSLAPKF